VPAELVRSRTFIDTNVFVYALDADEPRKQSLAIEVLQDTPSNQVVTSTQVLGEFYVVVTSKLARPLTAEQAQLEVRRLAPLARVSIYRQLVLEAVQLSQSNKISYWDALVVRAAAVAGCARLLSEDLGDDQVISGVRVENPFATRRRALRP
jgi:predicted nucleic acid-binding protein